MLLRARNITKYFNVPAGKFLIFPRWKKVKVLKGISFNIDEGEFVALLGPNGSGKTTTIKILSGILTPEEGKVEILGYVPWERKAEFLKSIGVLFGNRSNLVFDVPLMDSFLLLKDIYGLSEDFFNKRVKELAGMLGISSLLNTPVRKLSFGQRMRAEVMAVFLHKPKLVMLDEPTIGLDPVVKDEVRKFLKNINKKEKVTIILTTHNIQDVEYLCRRTLLIKNGELIWDGPTEALKTKYVKFKELEGEFGRIKDRRKLKALSRFIQIKGNRIKGKVPKHLQIKLIKLLFEAFELKSLNIREPELEEIIKQIYGE